MNYTFIQDQSSHDIFEISIKKTDRFQGYTYNWFMLTKFWKSIWKIILDKMSIFSSYKLRNWMSTTSVALKYRIPLSHKNCHVFHCMHRMVQNYLYRLILHCVGSKAIVTIKEHKDIHYNSFFLLNNGFKTINCFTLYIQLNGVIHSKTMIEQVSSLHWPWNGLTASLTFS